MANLWYSFKAVLKTRLKQVYTDKQYGGERIYNKLAPQNALYPHSRYTVQWIPRGNQNTFQVVLDTWDNAKSCQTLERLQDYFIDDLDEMIDETENLFFSCDKTSITDVIEDTEELNRRQIILDFKVQRAR